MGAKLEILWRVIVLTIEKLLRWVEDLFRLKTEDQAQIYSKVGQKHADKGNLDHAISTLKRALELNPHDTHASFKLAKACAKKGLYDDAIQYYMGAEGNGNDGEIFYQLGLIYNRKGLMNEAIDSYKKSIEARPGEPNAYFRLGLIYDGRKEHAAAIEHYQKAIAIDPLEAKYFYSCGLALDASGQHDKAIDYFRKAMESENSEN